MAANVGRLCAGGEIEFRLPITEVQFIDKSSLFILLLGVIISFFYGLMKSSTDKLSSDNLFKSFSKPLGFLTRFPGS